MEENEKSGKSADRNRRETRLNKALRQNLRKRKADAAESNGIMQRRTSIISKRTGPKLRRPNDGSTEE